MTSQDLCKLQSSSFDITQPVESPSYWYSCFTFPEARLYTFWKKSTVASSYIYSTSNITNLFHVCVCTCVLSLQELVHFSMSPANWLDRERDRLRGGQTWQWVCERVCQMSFGMPQRANHNHTAEINEVKSNQLWHTNRDIQTHTLNYLHTNENI